MTTRDYAAEYSRRSPASLARARVETPEQAARRRERHRRNWTPERRARWQAARRRRLATTNPTTPTNPEE